MKTPATKHLRLKSWFALANKLRMAYTKANKPAALSSLNQRAQTKLPQLHQVTHQLNTTI